VVPREIMKPFLLLIALAIASPAVAQQTFLDEDFTSGVFPPSGWNEILQGNAPGWESNGLDAAFHDDFLGDNNSHLLSPPMDLSLATDAWLHLDFGQRYARYRYLNAIEVTLDGGLTSTVLYDLDSLLSGGGQEVHLQLDDWLGQANVQLSFHYQGDNANEWWLDRVLIDDQAGGPAPRWPNLPTTFLPVNSVDFDLETLAGTVPAWMTLNAVDNLTRISDPEAWCNIGNLAPCIEANSGIYSLEMGLNSSFTGPHVVSNAMILAVNGAGFTEMTLTFQAKQFQEEWHEDDGVFVSEDGLSWFPVGNDWMVMTGGSADWTEVQLELHKTPVDLNGHFYLAIAESDDFPFGTVDGVVVDDVVITPTKSTLEYSVSNLVGGQSAQLDVIGAVRQGSLVSILFSTFGPGPMYTPFGVADMTPPLTEVGTFIPDPNGEVHETAFVPLVAVGAMIWTQAIELFGTDGTWTNSFALTVQ
jgi:hypothetical protein